jgi:hypothetical protein
MKKYVPQREKILCENIIDHIRTLGEERIKCHYQPPEWENQISKELYQIALLAAKNLGYKGLYEYYRKHKKPPPTRQGRE